MLTIRREQMDRFSDALTRQFAESIRPRIAAQLPDGRAAIEPEVLTETIYRGCMVARSFRIRSEADVERFIAIVLKRWPGFSDGQFSRPLLSILTAYGMDSGVKLDRFEAALEKEAPHA